ncbi:uncharacterized protein LACBIDRAFT_324776 [Laccaria bicolor S238N-H82]|uniref:Predicted protein n=1 Tax=Laccaria bicolor (strain S238N-H82 / ATCC MYA-4686) TaxID=486041 RepID=B0D304_LACBS|nr:uncharacterized protein LACBIDRAFT_324776 [Laccaria bicolor S238N-H82]EDR11189.1 predicted protein [Laccaria bicolor S238N-H82]|eukprot:XP_001878490.1 predicted protein [Laccaria bicolor S238N-H82]
MSCTHLCLFPLVCLPYVCLPYYILTNLIGSQSASTSFLSPPHTKFDFASFCPIKRLQLCVGHSIFICDVDFASVTSRFDFASSGPSFTVDQKVTTSRPQELLVSRAIYPLGLKGLRHILIFKVVNSFVVFAAYTFLNGLTTLTLHYLRIISSDFVKLKTFNRANCNSRVLPSEVLDKDPLLLLRNRGKPHEHDDPLLWPQPYISSACHYGAIPHQLEHDGPMDILWWNPNQTDLLVNSSDLILGIGKIPHARLLQFQQLVGGLQDHVEKYKSDNSHPTKNSEIITLSNWLSQGLSRLEQLPMDVTQVKFCVAEVQQAYLELTAGLNYLYIYKP